MVMQPSLQKEQLSRLQKKVRCQHALVIELLNATLHQVERSVSESWQPTTDTELSTVSYFGAVRLLQGHLSSLHGLGMHIAEMLRQVGPGFTTLRSSMADGHPRGATWPSVNSGEPRRRNGSIDRCFSITNDGSSEVPAAEGAVVSDSSNAQSEFLSSDDCAQKACSSEVTGSGIAHSSFSEVGAAVVKPTRTPSELHSSDDSMPNPWSSLMLQPSGTRSGLVPSLYSSRDVRTMDIVDVGTPSLFWLRFLPSSREAMMSQLRAHFSENKPKLLTSLPARGDIVGSLFLDGIWYRALVIQTDSTSGLVEVLYIDYGNIEITDISRLTTLEPTFANESAQAIPCCLDGLLPPDGDNDWSSSTVALFTSMIQQASTVSSDGSSMVLTAAVDVVSGFPVAVVSHVDGTELASAVELLLCTGLARRGSSAEFNAWLVRQHGAAFVSCLQAFLPTVKRSDESAAISDVSADGFSARTDLASVPEPQTDVAERKLVNDCPDTTAQDEAQHAQFPDGIRAKQTSSLISTSTQPARSANSCKKESSLMKSQQKESDEESMMAIAAAGGSGDTSAPATRLTAAELPLSISSNSGAAAATRVAATEERNLHLSSPITELQSVLPCDQAYPDAVEIRTCVAVARGVTDDSVGIFQEERCTEVAAASSAVGDSAEVVATASEVTAVATIASMVAAAAEVPAAAYETGLDLDDAQSNRASNGGDSSSADNVERSAAPVGSGGQGSSESVEEDVASDVNSLSCVPSSRSEDAISMLSIERVEVAHDVGDDGEIQRASGEQGVASDETPAPVQQQENNRCPETANGKQTFLVLPSCVVSPVEFYVNLVTEESVAAMQTLDELTRYYSSISLLMLSRYLSNMTSDLAGSRLQIGDLICAAHGESQAFYRARVEDVLDPNTVRSSKDLPDVYVFFIDYGNREWVRSANQVLPLRPHYADIPPQAVFCRLEDVEPADGGEPNSWSKAAVSSMQQLVTLGDTYYAQFLNPFEQLSSFNVDRLQTSPYSVLLAKRDSCSTINETLVSLGHARSTSLAAAAAAAASSKLSDNSVNDVRDYQAEDQKYGSSDDDLPSSSTSFDGEVMVLDDWDPLGDDYRACTNSYKVNPDDPEYASVGYLSQRKRICNYFATSGKCYRGNNCHFEHVRHRPGAVTADSEEIPLLRSIEVPYVGMWTCVEVSCVINPNHFYIVFPFGAQPVSFLLDKQLPDSSETTDAGIIDSMADSLEALQKGLNHRFLSKTGQLIASHRAPVTDYAIGEIVAAQFSRDKQMYRARIIESDLDGNEALVYFVDFGNEERVPLSNLRALEPQFLHLPCQAIEASLLVVPPPGRPGKRTFDQAAIDAFIGLVNGKLLFAHILQRYGNERIDIELCEASSKGDVFVTQELIKSGHAKRQSVQGCFKKPSGTGKPEVTAIHFPG